MVTNFGDIVLKTGTYGIVQEAPSRRRLVQVNLLVDGVYIFGSWLWKGLCCL
jgi:hypothetical protein